MRNQRELLSIFLRNNAKCLKGKDALLVLHRVKDYQRDQASKDEMDKVLEEYDQLLDSYLEGIGKSYELMPKLRIFK